MRVIIAGYDDDECDESDDDGSGKHNNHGYDKSEEDGHDECDNNLGNPGDNSNGYDGGPTVMMMWMGGIRVQLHARMKWPVMGMVVVYRFIMIKYP
jgi:hypothetical protein